MSKGGGGTKNVELYPHVVPQANLNGMEGFMASTNMPQGGPENGPPVQEGADRLEPRHRLPMNTNVNSPPFFLE